MDDSDPAADAIAAPPVHTTNIFQTLRAALKGRVTAIRAHLEHARYGDHRGTVAALTHLTDLVSDMFGPDSPEDSLRGALSDLAAGRSDDARKALKAANVSLRAEGTGIEAERINALVALIAAAEATLQAGDRADARNLVERALAIIEPPAP